MPLVPTPAVRWIGPGAIVGLAAGYAALWFAAEPTGQPGISYLGQFLGAEAILLLSAGLILISTLPWVEVLFDGIDKAAIWHRRVAITGVVLLIPHILLAASPRRSSLGPPLAVIGVIGLMVLVVWCGPAGMVTTLQSGFRRLGVPGRHIYREYFDWR